MTTNRIGALAGLIAALAVVILAFAAAFDVDLWVRIVLIAAGVLLIAGSGALIGASGILRRNTGR